MIELEKVAKKYKCICLLGVTGHGKSTTANTLVGNHQAFKTSNASKSETS